VRRRGVAVAAVAVAGAADAALPSLRPTVSRPMPQPPLRRAPPLQSHPQSRARRLRRAAAAEGVTGAGGAGAGAGAAARQALALLRLRTRSRRALRVHRPSKPVGSKPSAAKNAIKTQPPPPPLRLRLRPLPHRMLLLLRALLPLRPPLCPRNS
jgi:hypothetical protein